MDDTAGKLERIKNLNEFVDSIFVEMMNAGPSSVMYAFEVIGAINYSHKIGDITAEKQSEMKEEVCVMIGKKVSIVTER